MDRFRLSLLIFIILAPVVVRSLSPSLNDDVLGLIVFKADLQDPTGKLSSWNEDDDSPCNWRGVLCNSRSNRVSELDLEGFSLSGRIGRGLLQLQALRKLSLANNNLTGALSPGLFRLPNLRILDLSRNSLSGALADDYFQQCGPLRSISLARNEFSGPIPGSLTSCSSLAVVNLSLNRFTGVLPSGIWSIHGLKSLDLSGNSLEGDLPSGIGGLFNLKTIDLSSNQFTGEIPLDIGDCSLLKSVDLSENQFSGSLPTSMPNLTFCSFLNLGKNILSGEVPSWIGKMRALETLDFSTNNFSGGLPPSIGELKSLKVLNFSLNSLTGSLPESMISCTSLQSLDLQQNSLAGNLPEWVFKSATIEEVVLAGNNINGSLDGAFSESESVSQKIRVLDLSNNGLTGVIPSAISGFSSLQILNMSLNSLTGSLPVSIGELKALTVIDLSQNHMNGSIPTEIGEATSLKELILEKNSLEGYIPASIEHCSSLNVLILAHNVLSGAIPVSLSKLTNLQTVDLSNNQFSGSLPKQLANLPNLISFNISHNDLQGELPPGGFFNTISSTSVSNNPGLCGSAVKKSCPAILPKPIVLNPNSTMDSSSGAIPPTITHKKTILSISALIAIGAAAVIVIGVIAITVLNLHVRASASRAAYMVSLSGGDDFSNGSPTTDANSGKLVMFSGEPDFSTGTHALLNKDCELGRGGFGAVYKTVLGDGKPIAIKKLTVSSLVKSQEDFEREVRKLGKIRHPNIVELEGYYWTPSLQLLIYEFVPSGSLHKHLHEGSGESVLSWNDRFNVILGMAKGLAHLHQSNLIHYNLKSSNILIGASGEPKVGDFGLARLLPMLDRYVLSSKIQSALGYMAPEFACKTVKITEKCDVYGFGVLVLEAVTGKKPVEYMEDDVVVLCDMVRGALEEGRVEECVDLRLQGKFPAEEAIPVMKLGLICTSQVPSNRPDMGEVVNILELIRCPGQEE